MQGIEMLASEVRKAANIWPSFSEILYVPHSDHEFEELVRLLDNLIDEVGEDEAHPLASLMEVVGVLIEKYEDEHIPEPAVPWRARNAARNVPGDGSLGGPVEK